MSESESVTRQHNTSVFLGDAAALLCFAAAARVAHNSPELPLTGLGILNTAWPFWIGLGVGWAGLAAVGKNHDMVAVKPAGLTVWASSVIVGLGIWGIKHGQIPHWSFIAVAGSTSALLLLGWRGVVQRRRRRR